ncbi:MAG: peptidylprolyl isomerase [Nitrososphaerota archaeon]|nr:peptidylprolyl isomerase [Nitrososphaerota archaeon]
MPHTSKKYRKVETPESGSSTYIVIIVIVAIIAAAGGWYAYTTFAATASSTTTATTCNTTGIICADLYTSKGTIEIELFQSLTPKTVANFVNLSNSGFYDNLVWHRIVQGFVIQTGDPNTRNGGGNRSLWGTGVSPISVPLEVVPSLHNDYGYIGLAHTSASTSGSSQFYINMANNTNLDGQYTVFGKVISGMSAAVAISDVPVYTSGSYLDQPITPVYLINVTILSSA